jgi:2,4-dienoyl-CoA reductase-like NADH-dependent reductase (Old Yellow Enzyme family)
VAEFHQISASVAGLVAVKQSSATLRGMSDLFSTFTLQSITLRNRIGVSPMCMYSSENGHANDWHLVHLGARAAGGAGLVIAEATAVSPEGRITPGDAGLWTDSQIEPLVLINRFVKAHGAVPGIQLAHAGRKASAALPWNGGAHLTDAAGGWPTIAPSAIAFGGDLNRVPLEMSLADIARVQANFVASAKRALAAGYEWLELHSAHGYLSHEFLSPLSNQRTDRYGGSFENRIRFTLETARALRAVWPEKLPLTARISCTDWAEGGWTPEESVELSRRLKAEGFDLIDCSSGGLVGHAKIPLGPGYQVPFAEKIRREAQIATAAVGMITDPAQADEIIRSGKADLVLLARAELNDPNWPLHAAKALGRTEALKPPSQYLRAF